MSQRPNRAVRTKPCKICGGRSWCYSIGEQSNPWLVYCMRRTNGSSYINPKDGAGVYVLGSKPSDRFFEEPDESLIAPDKRCDEVYRALLAQLEIDQWSYENLLERGLSNEEIGDLGYRSTFKAGEAIRQLLRMGLRLDNVPGLYFRGGKWRANAAPGFFIPVLNRDGRIRRLQIRTPYEDPKYVWFSSDRDKDGNKYDLGASSGSPVHYRLTDGKVLWINEAPLKTDYVWLKSNRQWSCIGSAGVGSAREELAEETLNPQYQYAVIAADGNWRTNGHVARAVARLYRAIEQTSGLETKIGVWEGEIGIDEALKLGLKLYEVSYDYWLRKINRAFRHAIERDAETS